MEKKYVIHILAITAIDAQTFDLPKEQNAIIVCTNRINKYVFKCELKNILLLNFTDVENKKLYGAFNKRDARRIIQFIKNLSDEVTDIYVCCSKGGSRSPAVAAALLRMSGRDDKKVWLNPYYVPNILVYRVLCREYGLPTSRLFVWIRNQMNKHAFRKAKKQGHCEYERWQILE